MIVLGANGYSINREAKTGACQRSYSTGKKGKAGDLCHRAQRRSQWLISICDPSSERRFIVRSRTDAIWNVPTEVAIYTLLTTAIIDARRIDMNHLQARLPNMI
jgi:ribosome modulation factor